MNIHFVGSTLVRGGAETMAAALTRKLLERGHDVRWSLLREPGDIGAELAGEVDLESGLAPGRMPLAGVSRLQRRLSTARAVYTLDHQNAVVATSVAAPLAGVERRVVAIHSTGLFGGRSSLGRWFRLALPSYDHVLALSPSHAQYLTTRERVPAGKIAVVPNGIDLSRFRDLPTPARAREALDLPASGPVLGTVAMLRPEKNQRVLLESAAVLRRRYPDLQVVLVGEGDERAALEARAAEPDLAGAVHFLGRRSDVLRLLPAFTVFALPSHPVVETQPVSVLEAMAAGVPVVATRVGDLAAMLEDGGSGLLVPPGDAEAFRDAVDVLLAEPETRERLIRRAGVSVSRYGLDAAVDALLGVWEGSVAA